MMMMMIYLSIYLSIYLADLGWLARFRERPLSRFLMAVQARFAAAGEMDIRSEQVQPLSDIE